MWKRRFIGLVCIAACVYLIYFDTFYIINFMETLCVYCVCVCACVCVVFN